jgi:hypothetical protein
MHTWFHCHNSINICLFTLEDPILFSDLADRRGFLGHIFDTGRSTLADRDRPRSVVTPTSNVTAGTAVSIALLDDAVDRLTGTVVVGPVPWPVRGG